MAFELDYIDIYLDYIDIYNNHNIYFYYIYNYFSVLKEKFLRHYHISNMKGRIKMKKLLSLLLSLSMLTSMAVMPAKSRRNGHAVKRTRIDPENFQAAI